MQIKSVDYVGDVERAALYASAVISVDKGISNRIERIEIDGRDGRDVITDEGDCFRFIAR